jgi:hypothetical protein
MKTTKKPAGKKPAGRKATKLSDKVRSASPMKPPFAHMIHEEHLKGKVADAAENLNKQFLALAYTGGATAKDFAASKIGAIKSDASLTQFCQIASIAALNEAEKFGEVMGQRATAFGPSTCAKLLAGRHLRFAGDILRDTGLTTETILSQEGFLRKAVIGEFSWDLSSALYRAIRARVFTLIKDEVPAKLRAKAQSTLVVSVDVDKDRRKWSQNKR